MGGGGEGSDLGVEKGERKGKGEGRGADGKRGKEEVERGGEVARQGSFR